MPPILAEFCLGESGGEKVGYGSGGMSLLRAAQKSSTFALPYLTQGGREDLHLGFVSQGSSGPCRGHYTIIKDYVREHGRRNREVFVPLTRAPGHAQADFGEAVVVIGGVEQKAHFFAQDLPHLRDTTTPRRAAG